jgi:multisubunit Na+/H+ antiporter MnhE subunit
MVRAIEVTAWAAACVGIWLLTLSSVTVPDLCLAVPAGMLCGVLAAAGRRLAGGRWQPQLRWAVWLLTLPVAVIADTIGVWRAAARAAFDPGQRARERLLQLPGGEPDDVAATRRGIATLAFSASPGSYVLDFDPDRRELLIHTLADSAPSWARINPDR